MLAIALGAWALVIIYMACALSYRQIERARARSAIVERLTRACPTCHRDTLLCPIHDAREIEQARASIETPVLHIGFTIEEGNDSEGS